MAPWCLIITTAKFHSTKPELRFCAVSNPACGVPEIRDVEDLWQWSRLEIRLNAFCRSTIPKKQFVIPPVQMFSCKFFEVFNNALLLKHLRSTPKFQPTLFYLAHAKILWTGATYTKILWTHANRVTHAKIWSTPSMNLRSCATHAKNAPTLLTAPTLFTRTKLEIALFIVTFFL